MISPKIAPYIGSSSFLEIFINLLLPVCGHRLGCPEIADRFADGVKDHMGAYGVCMVIGGSVCVNAEAGCFPGCVDVGT